MTTHLRARAVQAGAFLAVVGGTIAVAASPALADPPDVTIDSVSSTTIATGDRTTIKFTITNPDDTPGAVTANVSGMDCKGDCSPRTVLNGGQSASFTAELTGGRVDAGDTETVRVQVSARLNNETADATENITVRGPDKPQQVRQVSGRVKDADGDGVSGAQILLRDAQGHQYETTSGGDGGYEFTSSDDKPISPGRIIVGAGKDGYNAVTVKANGAAGKTVNVSLTLSSKAASPSATPSPTETASEAPLDEATDPAIAATDVAPTTKQAANADDGNGSLLFIILGGLLVAAGVGAIVLVLMRRKGGEDEDDVDGPGGVPPGGAGAGGFPDATRVAAPVGARASDATMITPMSGAPSMSDAPTMLQRPVPAEDEFPDPYGVPAVPPTYGTAPGSSQYGSPTQYGDGPAPAQGGGYHDGYAPQPQQPTQYGAPQGYEQPRYDEPTGMYRPEPTGGFPPQGQGYDQGGYGQEPEYPPAGGPNQTGGYGSWDSGQDSGTAYGAGGGGDYGRGGGQYGGDQGGGTYGGAPAGGSYGAPAGGTYGAPAGGTYGAPAGGGYGEDGGYDPRAAYGRPQGYDPGARQQPYGGGDYGDQAGYPEQQGGGGYYGGPEQGGGRHGGGQPPQQPPAGRPGQRRPVDWLDD